MSPRWRKVWTDLAGSKTRALLVILSIAMGVFGVGFVAASTIVLSDNLTKEFQAASPASLVVYTDTCAPDYVRTVREVPGVLKVEGRRTLNVRVEVSPGQWRNMTLTAIPNYDKMAVNKIKLLAGEWPPPVRQVLLEKSSLNLLPLNAGDKLEIETRDGKRRTLQLGGVVYDGHQLSTFFTGQLNGYISFDTLEKLGQTREYNTFAVITDRQSQAENQQLGRQIREKLQVEKVGVNWVSVPEPGEHPLQDSIDSMVWLLRVLGILVMGLSGFLLVNTVSAIIAQQVRQIGVMKAVGATTGQIAAMFLALVVCYSLLALAVAVPLRLVATYFVVSVLAKLMTIEIHNFGVHWCVLALEAAVAIIIPTAAALGPVFGGARITVREAVNSYGLSDGVGPGQGWVGKTIEKVRGLPRPMMLSLGNTFRRKGRLALTLATLTAGGLIFMSVLSVRDSLYRTADDAIDYYRYDISIAVTQAKPFAEIERVLKNVDGVTDCERWEFVDVQMERDGIVQPGMVELQGMSPVSTMLRPMLVEGRWLLTGDANAVVVNTELLRRFPWVKVGSQLVLKVEQQRIAVQVVGVVRGVLAGPMAYVTKDYLTGETRQASRYSRIQISAAAHDAAFQAELGRKIDDSMKRDGMTIRSMRLTSQLRTEIKSQFDIIIVFLLIMAVLLAVVGGLGLMGTMSINVIERAREIGIMRALGASDAAIMQIFITEGVIIGLISCLLATALVIPVSMFFSAQVGMLFLNTPLSYVFSYTGVVIWLGLVVALSAAASFWPAWKAVRVSVLEALAYQ